jgi:parallel beta-helix repeat protein
MLVFISLMASCLFAQGDNHSESLRMGTVIGNAFLEGETDHSGVMIIFNAQSPSAVTDTGYTISDGSYAVGLSDGIYEITFSKNNFLTTIYPEVQSLSGDVNLANITLLAGIIVSGNVSGIWLRGSTYLIEADVSLNEADTLIIEPGVTVKFAGSYELSVSGVLLAQGEEGDSVKFTSSNLNPSPGDWQGINFLSSSSNNSIISYCTVEYAASSYFTPGAIRIANGGVTIENSAIRFSNDSGISIVSNAYGEFIIVDNTLSYNAKGIHTETFNDVLITNNTINNNQQVGIYCKRSPDIINNKIFNNGSYGIQCDQNSTPSIIGNSVYGHTTSGIYGDRASPVIEFNIIFENSRGCWLAGGNNVTIANNTIFENSRWGITASGSLNITGNIISGNTDVGIYLSSEPLSISYNLINDIVEYSNEDIIPLSFGDIYSVNFNGDSVDTYNNLFMAPLFSSTNSQNGDFLHLDEESPCIDGGPSGYLDSDSTIRDIGAYYFNQSNPSVPEANFTSNVVLGSFPLYAQFINTTAGAVTGYEWVFGDNTTSTQANPVHAYTAEGIYSVSLTAIGPGGVDTEVKSDYITVTAPHYPPEISFSGSPVTGINPLTVNFSSTVVNDLDSIRWYFGDGGTSTAANPTYTYQDVGTYNVILNAYGSYGTDTETKSNYINVIAPNAVSAVFSALPLTGIAPMGVQFTNSSVGTIDSVRWHFGDGITSTHLNPAHEYQSAGIYTISLNVYGPVNDDIITNESYVTVYDARPIITSVEDVPNDQGGKVLLRWASSGFDGLVGSSINQYSLWQKYNNEWISINNTLATQSESYTYLASTFSDSTASGIGWSRFKIIAHTSAPSTFFTSPVDSGYSIDNIPPEAPGQLLAVASDTDVSLEWGSSNEPNFMYYKVFRNWEEITEQTSSQYLDIPASFTMPLYYQVVSVDDAGNQSPGTNEVLVDNTDLNWYVNIRADQGGEYNDNDNFLGVADDATNGYDVNYDIIEPPSPPNGYVGLYFPHPEWSHVLGNNFTQDIKPGLSLADALQVWNFDVIGDQSGGVDLTFNLSDGFPVNATIILKNTETDESYLIENENVVSLTVASGTAEHFSISIGNNSPEEPLIVSLNAPATTGFASLTWVDNSDIEEGYIISKSTNSSDFSYVDSLYANTSSYAGVALADLEINTQYYFKVNSYNLVANSNGVTDSLFTLSSIPSAPVILDSTLTTINISIDEGENPPHTEFAVGVTGGSYGQTIHYIQSDGTILGDTSQVWATESAWGSITVLGLAPETEYSFKTKGRNGNLTESEFGSLSARSTGNYPTVSLIYPVGPAILQCNTDYTVNWTLSNPAFVDSVFLYYSSDGGSTYGLINSMGNANTYLWTTPTEYLTYGGQIKVSIKDEAGLFSHDESDLPFVIVGDSLSNPIETGWSLWGVPLSPYLTPINENLNDDFSGGWWSFAYGNDGYTINSDLLAGEGYWLATDSPAIVDVQGQPATSATTLEITSGWELLTNPLVTDVDKDSLLVTRDNSTIPFSEAVSSGWVTSEFYHYSSSLGGYEMLDVLEPWKGYWLGVMGPGVSITFPIHTPADPAVQTSREILTDFDWRITFEVESGGVSDFAVIGVDSNATDQFDIEFDVPKPPASPNTDRVEISLNHPDWNPVLGDDYIVDIRTPLELQMVKEWEFMLSSNIEDSVMSITWIPENIPEDMVYTLEYNSESINLQDYESIDIPYSPEVITSILRAEKAPVSAKYSELVPDDYCLKQNFPNPFNPSTTIRYGLPEESNVSLVIYDVRGQVLQTLESGRQSAGWYDVIWNGDIADGSPSSTGIYFARLVVEDYTQVVKMLYLK